MEHHTTLWMQNASKQDMNASTIKPLVLMTILALGSSGGFAQTDNPGPKQDMKNAGSDTKQGAVDAGHGVSQGTHTAYHKTAAGTQKGYDKTKSGTETGYHKTVQGTQTGYHKTVHASKTGVHKVEGKPDTPANNPQQ